MIWIGAILVILIVCVVFGYFFIHKLFPTSPKNNNSPITRPPTDDLLHQPPHVRVQLSNYAQDLFDNRVEAYYINLDRSAGRREQMEKKLKEQQLSATRQPAVDGRALDLKDHAHFVKHVRGHFEEMPSRLGHLGCFLSQLAVYRRFLSESSRDYCLVMEDDCTFYGVNFRAEVADVVQRLPDNKWDILLCGYHMDDDWDYRHKEHNSGVELRGRVLHNIHYFTGLHCYLVRRDAVRRLLSLLSQPQWYIDWEISRHTTDGKLKVCGIFPPVVCQPAAFHVNVGDIRYKYSCPCSEDSLTNNF